MVQRGEIYWVDFGIPRGSEQGGERPALIIQNDIGNQNGSTTIIAAMTTTKLRAYAFVVKVLPEESGLKQDGYVHLGQIQTIPQDRLGKYAGKLTATKMTEVDKALRISLHL